MTENITERTIVRDLGREISGDADCPGEAGLGKNFKPRIGVVTTTTLNPAELDQQSVNTIRFLAVDAVQKANSGHPGLPLGAAPMAYVLWTRFLRHNPANPHWFNRDRFVLSAGHGSMLLYSLLHLTGYDLPLEQIKQFR